MDTLTPRERMMAVINGEVPDRVPLDIWATWEVWEKLFEHFGTRDIAAVKDKLHVDGFGGVEADYVGPPIPTHENGVTESYWGFLYESVRYGTGVYQEQTYYPLAFAQSEADLDDYAWPSADWFDFSQVAAKCSAQPDLPIMAGYAAPFYFYMQLRGMELALMDMALKPELAHAIIGRACEFFYQYAERLFEAGKGRIDVTQLTDDFGSQTGLIVSEGMIEEFFMPHYERLSKLMGDHSVTIFHHDDGAMWDLLPRLVEVGVRILNPVQYRCGPIDLGWLKDTYGKDLVFHGGVDNQKVLPFGSVSDVVEEVRKCIATLGRDGGYILAPCHNIQAVSPVENVLAMYETAYEEGRYA